MPHLAYMRSRKRRVARRRGAFSLIELIVALGVLSVAVGIFVQLFGGSLDLARQGRNHTVAVGLAEAQLNILIQRPNDFRWERDPEAPERPFPIRIAADDPKAGNPVSGPEALPAEVGPDVREQALYDQFRWKAFGRTVPGMAYSEVTVVVHWEESGQDKKLALTSAVPQARVTAWVDPTPEAPAEDNVEDDAAPAAEAEGEDAA